MGFISAQITEENVRNIAENSSEAEILMEASTVMTEGYLYFSEILVDKLLILKPENPNYNYRKGFLSLQIRKDYNAAIPFLEKAIEKVDPN
ncbi:MAG: hypothetical protein ACKVJC_04930, partial [Flavobacteriales bacterium]